MRRLRARCTACGEVYLPADDITVTEYGDGERVTCTYSCPDCGDPCELTFGLVAGRMHLLTGADTTPVTRPPLTLADLDTLRELMDRPDFVARMGRMG